MDTPVGPLGGPGLAIPPDQPTNDQDAFKAAFNKTLVQIGISIVQSVGNDAIHAVKDD